MYPGQAGLRTCGVFSLLGLRRSKQGADDLSVFSLLYDLGARECEPLPRPPSTTALHVLAAIIINGTRSQPRRRLPPPPPPPDG